MRLWDRIEFGRGLQRCEGSGKWGVNPGSAVGMRSRPGSRGDLCPVCGQAVLFRNGGRGGPLLARHGRPIRHVQPPQGASASPTWEDFPYVPWPVTGDAAESHPVKMLRLLARRGRGETLTQDESLRLNSWLSVLDRENAVVAFNPDIEPSIFYTDRRPEDSSGIPVRHGIHGSRPL